MADLLAVLGTVLFVALLYCLFVSLTVLSARFERVPIHEWASLDALAPPALVPYHAEMDRQAAVLGFVREAMQRHICHQIHSSVWRSPDGLTVARVSSGTRLRLTTNATMLISQSADGRYVETVDESGSADLSGRSNSEILLNADFFELAQRHKSRLCEPGTDVAMIESGTCAAFCDARSAVRVEGLIARGYVEYVDPERSRYRHTWRGAFALARANAKHVRRTVKQQRPRGGLKRPGSRGYCPRA